MEVMARQKLLRFIEPIGQLSGKRRYELALENFLTIAEWNSGNEIHPSESGNLKLQFLGNISPRVFTGIPIAGEENSLQVALLDVVTGEVVTSGPEASAKVEIVAVDGDFGVDEGGSWTLEEFNSKIVSGRDGKKSLLGGKRYLHLKDGIGSVHKIYFRHTSVWRRRSEYRLWARVVDHSNGRRIIAAKTEPFTVKDRRGMNKKHYPPSLSDEVWRLENIQKGGRFHKRLSKENIGTVKDFLMQYDLNHERLQEILGKSMTGKRWEATVNHAQTCKHYTSFAHRSLPSSDGLYPKNFNNPDCSNVCNFGTSDMHDHYKPTQPGTSFPDNTTNIDLYNLGPLFSDEDIENWLPFQNCDLEPVFKNLGLESVANQLSAVHAVAVTSGKLRSRWAIISKLRWLFKTRKLGV